jgi:NitT/TauT family transport system permease protein
MKHLDQWTDTAKQRRHDWYFRLGTIGIGVVILALWELLPLLGLVNPIILPPFTKVAEALYTLMQQPFFPGHLAVTFNEIMIGFVIGTLLGLGIGIALAVWPAAKRLTYPFVVGFQAIPKIVFAPLFIAWFGFGQTSKIVMAVVIAFFPVLINTMVGSNPCHPTPESSCARSRPRRSRSSGRCRSCTRCRSSSRASRPLSPSR